MQLMMIKEEVRQRLVDEYKAKFGDPYVAARNGWLDDVIEQMKAVSDYVERFRFYAQSVNGVRRRNTGNIPL